MPLSPALPVPEAQKPYFFAQIGFFSVTFYLFAFYSRFFDLHFAYLHLPGLAMFLGVAAALFSGGALSAVKNPIGAAMLALSAWFVICIPFAYWRAGSLQLVWESWTKSLLGFIVAASVMATYHQAKKLLYAIACGAAVGALLVTVSGDEAGGRLELGHGRFQNSNSIAMMLLIGMPFILLFLENRRSILGKVLPAAVLVAAVSACLKTGSRGGLLAMVVLMGLYFWRASLTGKVRLLVTAAILVLVLGATMPRPLKQRYLTLFSTSAALEEAKTAQDLETVDAATASTKGRQELLKQSLLFTLNHPIFGLGPGNFRAYEAYIAGLQGKYGSWLGTHNSYTQVSSETGIPGLALFLAILFFSFRQVNSTLREARRWRDPAAEDIARMLFALRASLIAAAVCMFFTHMAYEVDFPILAGVIIVAVRACRSELAIIAQRQPAAAPLQPVWNLPRAHAVAPPSAA